MSIARTHLRVLLPAFAALLALAFAASAQADYEQVGNFAKEGNGAALLGNNKMDIAVNTTGAGGVEAGSVYTASPERISRYSPTGEIREVWGWNTIASGPDLPNQVNTLKVSATSGTYELEAQTARAFARSSKGSKLLTGVFTEVGAFHVGDVLSGGLSIPRERDTGNVTSGSNTITSVVGSGWKAGELISGPGIPANTFISAFSAETKTLTISQPATGTGTGVSLLAVSVITAVGDGTIEISAPANGGEDKIFVKQATAPISPGATASELEAALAALPAFGENDVSVSGGPGDAAGTTPYTITFEGAYAGSPVPLASPESTLTGGTPSSSVSIVTSVDPSQQQHFERCIPANGDICVSQSGSSQIHGEGIGYFNGPEGVAVDQSTGYVYVLNAIQYGSSGREHNLIEVFSADGSESITRFGDAGTVGESFENGPEKLHSYSARRGIAVDEDGVVYLNDQQESEDAARVMCFRPETAGDYHHYVYCGRSHDVNLTSSAYYFEAVAVDDAGHVYAATQQFLGEYSLAEPSAPPLCTLNIPGQGRGMTVNAATGEVFFFNSAGGDRKVHRLKPCDPAVGTFKEAQSPIEVSPATKGVRALAVNPSLSWGPERSAGVLYGASSEIIESGGTTYRGLGYIFAPAEVHLPAIEGESVSNTRTASTILRASINPHGFGTRYVFQYLTESQYEANDPSERFAGATEAPVGGGEIGGGSIGEATTSISGLEPDTRYRFRVVATSECDAETNEPCVGEGEAASFSTYPLFPPGLPDHRAYELVSPPQKRGGEVIPADPAIGSCRECKPNTFGNGVFPMQSTPGGEAVSYVGQSFTPFEGAVNYDSYVARRTATGWQSTALIPALPPGQVRELAFDPSLDHGLLGTGERSLGVFGKLETQNTSEPSSTTPLVDGPNHRGASELQLTYGGHSADLSRIFFGANDTLTEATPFAPEPPDPGASKNDLYEWHEGQLTLVNVLPGNATVATGASFPSISPDTHAVSEDGSRAFFEDEAGNLYVRIDGEETRQVNDPGHFLSASPSGSEVLLDDGCLYSLESEACTDLTEGRGGFQGLVGQSTDLSHLYFVDTAVVAENEGAGLDSEGNPQVAEAGKNNLYFLSGGETRFIAQLTAKDNAVSQLHSELSDWNPNPSHRTAEASPNGRFLAFASVASLTGYDNVSCKESNAGKINIIPCNEAFLYDSATGNLTCASCNPTGEAPLGQTTLRQLQGSPERLPQPRYLTDEGRLYFDSQDSLVARDTNEGVEDVYEYSPQGTGGEGTCEREAGCTRLISAGTEAVDSNLIAVDETGKNVFFDTRDKLALKDKDELLDVYDAREGGGIAAESEISRAECQGENCQAPVAPPNDPTPASSSFEGAGNVKEAPAAKKHKKHAKKHKRHSKKHSKKHRKAKKHAKKARTAKRNHGGAK